jgi:hypothetical protein
MECLVNGVTICLFDGPRGGIFECGKCDGIEPSIMYTDTSLHLGISKESEGDTCTGDGIAKARCAGRRFVPAVFPDWAAVPCGQKTDGKGVVFYRGGVVCNYFMRVET